MSLKSALGEALIASLLGPVLALASATLSTSKDIIGLFRASDLLAYFLLGGIAIWVVGICGWWWVNRHKADQLPSSRAGFHGAMLLLAVLSFSLHFITFTSIVSGEPGSSTSVIALLLIPLLSVPGALLGAAIGRAVHALALR